MKPEELCIGDWVRLRYIDRLTKEEVVKDFQVGQLRYLSWKGKGETLYVGSDHQNMGRIEDIEPISVTHEILEKNGFEKKTFYGIYDDYFDFDIREYSDGLYIATYHSCEFNIPDQTIYVSWIHELQHFMRYCGIEKEITL